MTEARRKKKILFIVFTFLIALFSIKVTLTALSSEAYLQLTVEPPSIDFGDVDIGSFSEQILTVTNSGEGTLIIGQIIGPPEPFAIVIDSCSNKTLATNSFCTITLRFSPQAFVTYSTSLQIPYKDPTTQQQYSVSVSLEGSGWFIDDGVRGGCIVTSAARGSYLEPHVKALRDFRDRYLLTNTHGVTFVKFYYRHSTEVAEFINRNEVLRTMTRWLLTPMVYGIEFLFCP